MIIFNLIKLIKSSIYRPSGNKLILACIVIYSLLVRCLNLTTQWVNYFWFRFLKIVLDLKKWWIWDYNFMFFIYCSRNPATNSEITVCFFNVIVYFDLVKAVSINHGIKSVSTYFSSISHSTFWSIEKSKNIWEKVY